VILPGKFVIDDGGDGGPAAARQPGPDFGVADAFARKLLLDGPYAGNPQPRSYRLSALVRGLCLTASAADATMDVATAVLDFGHSGFEFV